MSWGFLLESPLFILRPIEPPPLDKTAPSLLRIRFQPYRALLGVLDQISMSIEECGMVIFSILAPLPNSERSVARFQEKCRERSLCSLMS